MATEIDLLMDLDPLEMSSKDIDAIIAYHRNNRAKENASGRMEKPKAAAGPKLDLMSLLTPKKADGEAPPKPQGGGIRRV